MSDEDVREAAYFIWEREGRPEGRALDHWARALTEVRGTDDKPLGEEEKIMATAASYDTRHSAYRRTCQRC